MPWIDGEWLDRKMEIEMRRDQAKRDAAFFQPRYKRYASWPAVIWCRLRRHKSGGRMYSGNVTRCIGCGDVVERVYPPLDESRSQ